MLIYIYVFRRSNLNYTTSSSPFQSGEFENNQEEELERSDDDDDVSEYVASFKIDNTKNRF